MKDRQNPTSVLLKSLLLSLLTGLLSGYPGSTLAQTTSQQPFASTTVQTIRLGYAPILSRSLLAERSLPLIDYFRRYHNTHIELHHSQDFDDYLEDAANGEFDLAISQVNYAEAFHSQLGFEAIASTTREFHVLVLKNKDNTALNQGSELKGKKIGVPEGLSFISALFKRSLPAQQLSPRDVELVGFNRHDQLLLALLKNQLDAAITVEITLQMAQSLKDKTTPLYSIPAGPAVVTAAPSLLQRQPWLQQALIDFTLHPLGQQYLQRLSFENFQTTTSDSLKPYHPYAINLHQKLDALKQQQPES